MVPAAGPDRTAVGDRYMKSLLLGASLAFALASACAPAPAAKETPAATAPAAAPAIPYGANAAASGTFVHDGVTLYYESYGEGDPLLLVHGNGDSLGGMAAQIDYFKAHYHVIAMDSREQGRSGSGDGPITYEIMADDLAALLDHLNTGPVSVVGWSDGGIEALLLGIRHPDKVTKLVAMAANLSPGLEAIYPETEQMAKDMIAQMPEGSRDLKVSKLMLTEPHIDPAALGKITAPTLILAGDHDLIRTEHTVEIYNSIPNANLGIFPNSTHMIPYDDPALFNSTVERFLQTPFQPKDRIGGVIASIEKMASEKAN